jgi:nucleotidyltransferase-like protein/aminoglycoside adenylyltransferase-like protein
MDLESAIGAAPAAYVAEIVARARDVLGGDLRGVCLMGSAALGDYRPGRSDIDVAVVAERPLPLVAREALVGALEHDALPCPARGLELVTYDPAGLADPGGPAYLINLNTGPRMDHQVSFDPADNPRFWFTLDVAIGRTLGRTLLGPPPADLFPELPDTMIRGAARESLDWWSANGGHPFTAVLAACVAWRWSETGTWSSKGAATRWAADRAAERDVLRAALDRREGDGGRPFDEAAARRFVAMVRAELAN